MITSSPANHAAATYSAILVSTCVAIRTAMKARNATFRNKNARVYRA